MKTWQHRMATAAIALLALSGLTGMGASAAHAAPRVIEVAGAQSVNLLGEDGNTVWWIPVGANAVLKGLDWSVQLEAFAPSVLSEMQISFGASSGLAQFTLAPGREDFSSGVRHYSGSLDLSSLGAQLGADGLLRIEFSEGYKDLAAGMAEGRWLGGQLVFDIAVPAVPEPAGAVMALLGVGLGWGLLGATVRGTRRRQ